MDTLYRIVQEDSREWWVDEEDFVTYVKVLPLLNRTDCLPNTNLHLSYVKLLSVMTEMRLFRIRCLIATDPQLLCHFPTIFKLAGQCEDNFRPWYRSKSTYLPAERDHMTEGDLGTSVTSSFSVLHKTEWKHQSSCKREASYSKCLPPFWLNEFQIL